MNRLMKTIPIVWRMPLLASVFMVVLLLVVYGSVVRFTVTLWATNETYAHGFLIPLISAWLIWRQRKALVQLQPKPNVWGILPFALFCVFWELGYQGSTIVVQQYALVGLMVISVWTLLGTEVFRQILFPLLFLFFAVPFGESFIPAMMNFTADFTVAALRLTGIPVYREGNFLTLPTGNWSVVEACSGLRYLVASMTLGVLYAYLAYRSAKRRALFIVASTVVPIVANGLRAYMIVMLGHLSGMRLAVGVDHLIYGWVFFGLVMLLLFWVGSLFREDSPSTQFTAASGLSPMAPSHLSSVSLGLATLLLLVLALLPQLYARHLDEKLGRAPLAFTLSPPPAMGSWQAIPQPLTDWSPHYLGSRTSFVQNYGDQGRFVSLFLAYYRHQSQGASLITSGNMLVTSHDANWENIREMHGVIPIAGEHIPVNRAILRSQNAQLLVWQWYWVDGRWVLNPYVAKALEAKSRILDGEDDAAVIIVATPLGVSLDAASRALQDFLQSMLPGIEQTLLNSVHQYHDN